MYVNRYAASQWNNETPTVGFSLLLGPGCHFFTIDGLFSAFLTRFMILT